MKKQDYQAAYEVGLDMHDRKVGFTQALKKLSHLNIKQSVAGDLLYNTTYLLKGRRYTRTLSIPITDDILTWIRRDRGKTALGKAVSALEQHIEYYEQLSGNCMKGLRAVLAKHKALLSSSDQTTLILEWDDGASRGYFDILPLSFFAKSGLRKGVIHVTRRSTGKDLHAKCDLIVGTRIAELNYESYAAFNNKNGMLIGIARLNFSDTDRTALESVEWKPLGGQFSKTPFKSPKYLVSPSAPYIRPTVSTRRTVQTIRERPGQTRFRRNLKSIYSQSCCITGCTVPEALEGAHIDAYKAPASDNLKNGLLLRRDVHCLFDKHLISIEPDSLTIRVAKEISGLGGYADLNGKQLRSPEDSAHNPDSGALGRHWKAFQDKHLND